MLSGIGDRWKNDQDIMLMICSDVELLVHTGLDS